MRSLIILIMLFFSSCEGSTYYREKNNLVKEYYQEFEILTIRVDDDAEYHITAINKANGTVKSINDADYNGYTTDDIRIRFSEVSKPIMKIKYSDRQEEGYFTEVHTEPYIIILPYNFKIETFDD